MPKLLASLTLAVISPVLFAAEPALLPKADPNHSEQADTLRYELQVVTAKPGKLSQLHDWFREHQTDVLAKHGALNLAYLVPEGENTDGKIVCLYEFPSLPAILKFSKAVKADPLWAPLDTSKDGPDRLVENVEIMQFRPTSYSPLFEPQKSPEPRVFELRTYTCPSPEKLAFLHERFKNHTMGLFQKHGIENLVYLQPLDLEDSDRKLVYLLGHQSRAAAKESFASFRKDPEWITAKEASEKKAGGSLTEKEGGVVSEFFVATEYSPLR